MNRTLLPKEQEILNHVCNNHVIKYIESVSSSTLYGQNSNYILYDYEIIDFDRLLKDGFIFCAGGATYGITGLGLISLNLSRPISDDMFKQFIMDYLQWEQQTKIDDRYQESLDKISKTTISKVFPEIIAFIKQALV